MGASNSRPYLRFAAISLFLVSLVALGAIFGGLLVVSEGEEEAAARSTAEIVVEPLASVLGALPAGSALPADARSQLDALAEPLITGNVESVSVWNADGALLYNTGEDGPRPAPQVRDGTTWERIDGADGVTYFATYVRDGRYAIEVVRDAEPVNQAIGASQWDMIAAIGFFAVAIWLLLQGAFWFGIRTFAINHGRLAYLYDTGQQLRSSLDLHDVLTRLATDATTISRSSHGLVCLFEEESSEVILKATYDHTTLTVALHQRAFDDFFIRRAIATNSTVANPQAGGALKQYFGQDVSLPRNAPLLCAPLSIRDRVVGAIAVARSGETGGVYNLTETRLLEELAAQAVTAVEQSQLFARVRADADQLELTYDSTLKALMAALDAKDEVTEGHCERVAKLTVQLARSMDMPESALVHIERGALLHDVGKIGVPDVILKKPKALNEGEWEAMRRHPLLAGLMVSKIGFLEPSLPILLYHHERYDGGGYPFGLSAENIPLEARIFSVIDAYDAMTSDRPYRPAMTHDAAMREVRTNVGAQFDPLVVDAFEELMASRPDLRETAGHHMGGDHDTDHLLGDHDDNDPLRTEHAA
jgi:HD-GYP domain-containing protein (c-di-GMP phosphodiesterase class II)